jgi:hypothetical protein
MASTKLITFLTVIALLCVTSKSTTNFIFTYDTLDRHAPIYPLGYLLANYTVMINLTTDGTSTGFTSATITLEPDLHSGSAVTCEVVSCTDAECVQTCFIPTSDRYQLNITTADTPAAADGSSPNQMQSFQVNVGYYVNATGGPSNSSAEITTLLKAT